jgi:hypothetical protein
VVIVLVDVADDRGRCQYLVASRAAAKYVPQQPMDPPRLPRYSDGVVGDDLERERSAEVMA